MDPCQDYLDLGREYLLQKGLDPDSCRLVRDGEFLFGDLGRKFDFAVAHSVFTHLSFEQIRQCVTNLMPVMSDGGQLLFTVMHNREKEIGTLFRPRFPLVKSSHGDLRFYSELAAKLGVQLRWLDDSAHGTQKVGVLRF